MKIAKIVLLVLNTLVLIFLVTILFTKDDFSKNISQKLGFNEIAKGKEEKVYLNKIDNNNYIETKSHIYVDNEYEEDILNKSDNEIYKVKELNIDNTDAFLLIVYDPSKVKMMVCPKFNTKDNSGKERITAMVERYGALAGVNGGGFFDNGKESKDIPMGYVIKDGEILWNYTNKRKGLLIGFSNDNKLMMLENVTGEEAVSQGMRDGLEFGPILIKNGVITNESKNSRWQGRASRLIMAQRDDGIVLFLATNGGTVGGARMDKLLDVLQKYGATNAANLDGGASTQLVVKGELLTHVNNALGLPVKLGRLVVNGWGIFP